MVIIAAHVVKDLRRLATERSNLMIWIGLPLLISIVMNATFGNNDKPPRPRLLVVDEDRSFATAILRGLMAQECVDEVMDVDFVEDATAHAELDDGTASAVLVLPAGFGASFARQTQMTLPLTKSARQSVLPEIVQEVLDIAAEAASHADDALRTPIAALLDENAGADAKAEAALDLKSILERVRVAASPPSVKVHLDAPTPKPQGSFGVTIFPGLLWMSFILMAQGLGTDYWKEHDRHTLHRIAATPSGMSPLVAGKAIVGVAMISVVTLAASAIAVVTLGIDIERLPSFVAWSIASGAMFVALFQVIALSASRQRTASLLGTMIAFPMMMVGGSFVPFELMPGVVAAFGRRTINGWSLERASSLLAESAEGRPSVLAFVATWLISVLLFILANRMVRVRFGGGAE